MILVGQSIQSMSKTVKEAVDNRNPEPIKRLAKDQAKAGADYLDLNLCSIVTDIVGAMQWVIDTVQDVVDLPLLINTTNPEAMEAGLKQCSKRPVINSANGMQDSKMNMLPLAAEYPADVILGTYDERGAPPSGDERAMLALELVEYSNDLGIPTESIWIDPAVYPVSTNQEQAVACIEFLQMIDDVIPGSKTITGISNISSGGVPKKLRRIINRTFFIILKRYNQYAGIVDVLDKELVHLNRGELPEIVQLIHRVMDEEEIGIASLSSVESAYGKAAYFLLGKEPYSQSALRF
jgi:cobalamin-dependent methionine synthase I